MIDTVNTKMVELRYSVNLRNKVVCYVVLAAKEALSYCDNHIYQLAVYLTWIMSCGKNILIRNSHRKESLSKNKCDKCDSLMDAYEYC